MSAFKAADLVKLGERIQEEMKKEMAFFHVLLPAYEGKMLAELKTVSILESLKFNEETEKYQCKGYIAKEHPLYKKLQTLEES